MVYITDISDHCMRLIFSRLPLSDLFGLDTVCPHSERWRSIQLAVGADKCSLTLVVSENYLKLPCVDLFAIPLIADFQNNDGSICKTSPDKWDSVKMASISGHIVEMLLKVFPNICNLVIHHESLVALQFEPVITLLAQLWPQLVTLKLYCKFSGYQLQVHPFDITLQLIDTINSMVSLKHLTVHFNTFLRNPSVRLLQPEALTQIDLPIIGQLEQFNFYSQDSLNIITELLKKYATKSQVRIGIGNERLNEELPVLYGCTAELRDRFSNLLNYTISANELETFSVYLPSMIVLRVKDVQIANRASFHTLLMGLRLQSQLVYLKMNVNLKKYVDEQFKYSHPEPGPIIRLPSIEIMELDLSVQSHTDIAFLYINWVFPNLQVLKINCHSEMFSLCSICKCGIAQLDQYNLTQVTQCNQLLVEMLNGLNTKLNTVYIGKMKFALENGQVILKSNFDTIRDLYQ